MKKKDTDTGEDSAAQDGADDNMLRMLTAEGEIKSYTAMTVAASVVPIPLFDIAAVAAIQIRMIQKLSQLYGQPFSDHTVRNIITGLAGGTLGYGAGATVAISLFKMVPGIGWAVGAASLPLVAGATTYAIGRVFLKHFEDGGTMLDLNLDKMRAYYDEQFRKGKEMAAKAKAKVHEATASKEEPTASAA